MVEACPPAWCAQAPAGYAGLSNVETGYKDDAMQSFWIAETLKYAFLLFSPPDMLPLDQWVFNTEAHPLKVLKTESAAVTGQLRSQS